MAKSAYEGMAAYKAGYLAGFVEASERVRNMLQDFIDREKAKPGQPVDTFTMGALTLAKLYRDMLDDAIKGAQDNDKQN